MAEVFSQVAVPVAGLDTIRGVSSADVAAQHRWGCCCTVRRGQAAVSFRVKALAH
jgi:hypothetical protein